ncbi:MAG TPA: phytanoyl-CoA dioxygenase family protein [Ferruginibacter sp.]|nr:phytanoyl-CoA dioxygenase family protein [Ferruginibacter sp.]HMP22099.1 phytanoyl-CoA dioxygenase family protein [Ferruginibacter sp.]
MKKVTPVAFQLTSGLTEEQLKFFKKNGYLHFKNFIPKETVKELLYEVEQVQQHLLANDAKKVNGIPLKFGNDINGKRLIQRIAFASQYSNKLHQFLQDSRLKALLTLLEPYTGRIGENEKDGLVVNHYVNTPASKFSQLGWHTDSPRDLFLGSRIMPMLNVGLHLDDCAFENGGLRVIPGTHRQGLLGLFFRKKYYVDNSADKSEVGFDIEAGDLTVHEGKLWHRVQQSPVTGEASRRRVMYIPVVTGPVKFKHAQSTTPVYHKVAQLKPAFQSLKYNLAGLAKVISPVASTILSITRIK